MDNNGYPSTWTEAEIEESEHFCRHHPEAKEITRDNDDDDKVLFIITKEELRQGYMQALKDQRAYHKKEADRLLDEIIRIDIKSLKLERNEKAFN